MNKKEAIKTVQRMFREISIEPAYHGGFDEMDQTQTEFTLSDEFLNEVSLNGLRMLMDLVERNSNAGVNKKESLSCDQIAEKLNGRKH